MKVIVSETSKKLGELAGAHAAHVIERAIAEKGEARIVVSTGASQFDTLEALANSGVDFSKVTMFHLDEYIGIPESHPASFRRYLKERFVSKINLKRAVYVIPEGDVEANIAELARELEETPIDLGIIGVGENGHIAFNDPPADFNTRKSFMIVDLDEACKRQQMGEGWFPTLDDVPSKAITMTTYRIMQCNEIVSAVPYKVKAKAIAAMFEDGVSEARPCSLLKTHEHITLYLDADSASLLDESMIK